jgi:hypothetical protein
MYVCGYTASQAFKSNIKHKKTKIPYKCKKIETSVEIINNLWGLGTE